MKRVWNIKNGKKLVRQRKLIANSLPLEEMVRGTLIKRYLECIRPLCKCHKSKKFRHGPYYYLSIRKKDKSTHVYIPFNKLNKVKVLAENYNKVWKGLEEISAINIGLIKL